MLFVFLSAAFKVYRALPIQSMGGTALALWALLCASFSPWVYADVDIEFIFALQESTGNANPTANSTANATNSSAGNSTAPPPSNPSSFSITDFLQSFGQKMPTVFNRTDENTTEYFAFYRPLAVQSVKAAKILCVAGKCYDEAVYGQPPATTPVPLAQQETGSGSPVAAIGVGVACALVVLILIVVFYTRSAALRKAIAMPWSSEPRMELRPIIKASIILPPPTVKNTGSQAVGGWRCPPFTAPPHEPGPRQPPGAHLL